MSTLVCIPAFNEERFIGKLVKNCLKYADQVVVCDDGSIDNTYEVADAAGANVIRHEKNCGKGGSIPITFSVCSTFQC